MHECWLILLHPTKAMAVQCNQCDLCNCLQLLKHYWNILMLQHAGVAVSQHASRAVVKISEHCELWKTSKVITPCKDSRNLRLVKSALESNKSHRTIYYSWIHTCTNFFDELWRLRFYIRIRIISASSRAPLRVTSLTVLYSVPGLTHAQTFLKNFEDYDSI